MDQTFRVFVAFKLPDFIVLRAAALQNALRAKGLKLGWVKAQNLHLTLKFIGDVPETDLPGIGAAIRHVSGLAPPLQMALQGMGVFPNVKRARVLWVGLAGQLEALKQLHRKLDDQLEPLGCKREKRGFKAHLTIGRIKKPIAPGALVQAIQTVGDFPPIPFGLTTLVLYKSDLRPHGAEYTPLASADLTPSFDGAVTTSTNKPGVS
jgi:2'-5' RNA ligase